MLLRNRPEYWRALGFELLADGSIRTEGVAEINRRILEARRKGLKFAPSFIFFPDDSKEGADAVTLARGYVRGEIPYSLAGTKQGYSLSLHDLFLHGPAFLVLPRSVAEHSKRQTALLLELYDSVRRKPNLRKVLLQALELNFNRYDSSTASIHNALSYERTTRAANRLNLKSHIEHYASPIGISMSGLSFDEVEVVKAFQARVNALTMAEDELEAATEEIMKFAPP